MSAPNKRRGLRKLECDCGASIYMTFAQAERHGLPGCACGARFLPDDLELAMALDVFDAPVIAEYRERVARFLHAQAPNARSIRSRKDGRPRQLQPAELVVAERMEAERRECARANRLNALAPVPEPMPF